MEKSNVPARGPQFARAGRRLVTTGTSTTLETAADGASWTAVIPGAFPSRDPSLNNYAPTTSSSQAVALAPASTPMDSLTSFLFPTTSPNHFPSTQKSNSDSQVVVGGRVVRRRSPARPHRSPAVPAFSGSSFSSPKPKRPAFRFDAPAAPPHPDFQFAVRKPHQRPDTSSESDSQDKIEDPSSLRKARPLRLQDASGVPVPNPSQSTGLSAGSTEFFSTITTRDTAEPC